MAPAGTPPAALAALTRVAKDFAASPVVRERLAGAGLEPEAVCGEAFASQLVHEIGANTQLAKDLQLKAE